MNKSDIAREYIAKADPKLSKTALARCILNENPYTFTSIEDARDAIRYVTGNRGESLRSDAKNKGIVEMPQIPTTWAVKKPVFKLPIACNNILFLSDAQAPFHDVSAIEAACNFGESNGVNTIYLNGDMADFYQMSSFEKDPKKRHFKDERDHVVALLAWIRSRFPNATIYYNLDANHEARWQRWVWRHPEVYGMEELELQNILRLNKHNIIPLQNNDYCMIGKLVVLHGHTLFGKFGNVNKAKKVWDTVYKSCIASHVHIAEEYNRRDITGELYTTWTTGCLMDLSVEYHPHGNNYTHGFAWITTDNEGNFSVQNKRINAGKIL